MLRVLWIDGACQWLALRHNFSKRIASKLIEPKLDRFGLTSLLTGKGAGPKNGKKSIF
jgi:hypothetical protein